MTPAAPNAREHSLEEHLKTCSDREYAEYIISTMCGTSPDEWDTAKADAIAAIRTRPANLNQQMAKQLREASALYRAGVKDGRKQAQPPADALDELTAKILVENIRKKEFKPYLNCKGYAVWVVDIVATIRQQQGAQQR